MTLLFFDGLQDANNMPKPEWVVAVNWAGNPAGRDGVSNSAGTNAVNNSVRRVALPSAAATCIAGCAMKSTTIATGTQPGIMQFMSDVNTTQVMLLVNPSGMIEARKSTYNGTLIGTSSGHSPITVNTWHHFAAKVVLHTTSGSVVVQLDGVQVMSVSGVSTSTVTGSVSHVGFSAAQDTTIGFVTWDDIYVCDAVDATATQGRPNNDFLGDVAVRTYTPNAAGDSTQWTPSTGANYTTVDEIPVNTTDYVSDQTTGHRDLYNMTDSVGTLNTVYAIREGLYVTKTDSGNITIKPVIKENATVTTESAQAPTVGSWTGVYGPMKAVKPSNSAVWTQTDLDALQAGVEVG